MRVIKAVFKGGMLTPLDPLALPEDATVTLALLDADDGPAAGIGATALAGGAFSFLNDAHEDIYSPDDGEPV
jgi:hypothetical protein